jgi:hypothetical protein
MEGDLLVGAMNMPTAAALAVAILGGVFGLLRWFASRLLSDIDKRLARIDEIEQRLDKLAADMPLHYLRREDHIRDMTAISAKLDRIYEVLMIRGRIQ